MRNYKLQLVLASSLFAAATAAYAVCSHPTDSASYFGTAVAQQAASDSAVHLFEPKSLTDALPTIVYKYNNRDIRLSSLVATGKFSEPRKLDASINSEEPASTQTPPWQRGAVTFTINKVVSSGGLAQAPRVGDRLQVEFYFDPDVDVLKAEQNLADLNTAVAFLAGDGSTASPWTVAQSGSLVGQVDPGGRLSLLAAKKHADGRQLVDGILVNVSSLDELAAAVKQPGTVNVP